MAKNKVVIASIAVAVICVIFAGVYSVQLKAEKAKVLQLTGKVEEYKAELSLVNSKYEAQKKLVADLQYSIDNERKNLENAKGEIEALRQDKENIESRLDAAVDILQAPAEVTESSSEISAPAEK